MEGKQGGERGRKRGSGSGREEGESGVEWRERQEKAYDRKKQKIAK